MGCTRKGGCTFCVDLCEHAVSCPHKGPCHVNYVRPGAQKVHGNAGTVLTSGGNKPGVSGPRVSTDQGGTPKVVRDHRSTPVVRDHRTVATGGDHRPRGTRAEGRSHR